MFYLSWHIIFRILFLLFLLKAMANEDALLRTHCCRHKCFPACPRTQHLLRTQILWPGHKKCLILFRNILCPQQMFPSLRSPKNIMGNNVFITTCPRLPGPLVFRFDWENVWNNQDSVWPYLQTPRSLSKILHYPSYFQPSSRVSTSFPKPGKRPWERGCSGLEVSWNTVFRLWCITYRKNPKKGLACCRNVLTNVTLQPVCCCFRNIA